MNTCSHPSAIIKNYRAYRPQKKPKDIVPVAGICSSNYMGCGYKNRKKQALFYYSINSLRPRPNRRHFAEDIFKWIFLNENVWISVKISLKCVPKGPINKIPALVQIMAWRRPGDEQLSEPMMVRSLTHICVTRPQWVKTWRHLFVFLWAIAELSISWKLILNWNFAEWYVYNINFS